MVVEWVGGGSKGRGCTAGDGAVSGQWWGGAGMQMRQWAHHRDVTSHCPTPPAPTYARTQSREATNDRSNNETEIEAIRQHEDGISPASSSAVLAPCPTERIMAWACDDGCIWIMDV